MTFGERIRAIRKRRNLTIYDLAPRLGIGPSYLSSMECGHNFPSRAMVEKLAAEFDYSLNHLLVLVEAGLVKRAIARIQRKYYG